jgi:hypothetical protein
MKYINLFENYRKNLTTNIMKKFHIDDVVVSIVTKRPILLKGHRYIVVNLYGSRMTVKDIFNNELITFQYKNNFVTEEEWERMEIKKNTDKYNL